MLRPSRPPLVLIANDQEWAVRSLESVLGPRGFATLRAFGGRQAVELSVSTRPDAYILDYQMRDIGGVEVCSRLRGDPLIPQSAAIFITTAGGDTRAQRMEAYSAGAWEFCSQPFDTEILVAKLGTFTQAKLAADRLRDQSLVDEETGFYNSRGLAQRAREISAEAARRSEPVSCVAFCVDGEPLDARATADLAIAVRDVCRQTARASDALGRLGPNEFAILAPRTEEVGANRLVERLGALFGTKGVGDSKDRQSPKLHACVASSPDLATSTRDTLELLYSATASLRTGRASMPLPTAGV